jgi:hypothetical protein
LHENSTRHIARKPLAVATAALLAFGMAFALGATPAAAMPLSVNQAALQEAVPDNVVDVHRRYRGSRSGHAIAGLALGIIGTVIAERQYRKYHRRHYHHHYYHPHYYYGPPSCIRRHGVVYCR